MRNQLSDDQCRVQLENAHDMLNACGFMAGDDGMDLDLRVAALVTAAKEAAEKLQAAEAERDDNHTAWQGARDRASRLQVARDTAIRDAADMVRERDNCREVLLKEREERAAEKATTGQALASLRAEVNTLGETVEKMTAENARLVAQLEVVERIIVGALRGR